MNKYPINWEHVYLLGYKNKQGDWCLSTWCGDAPYVNVVVTGCWSVPLWNAKIPDGAQIHEIPEGKDDDEYAKEIGGILAMGWWLEKEIERS